MPIKQKRPTHACLLRGWPRQGRLAFLFPPSRREGLFYVANFAYLREQRKEGSPPLAGGATSWHQNTGSHRCTSATPQRAAAPPGGQSGTQRGELALSLHSTWRPPGHPVLHWVGVSGGKIRSANCFRGLGLQGRGCVLRPWQNDTTSRGKSVPPL